MNLKSKQKYSDAPHWWDGFLFTRHFELETGLSAQECVARIMHTARTTVRPVYRDLGGERFAVEVLDYTRNFGFVTRCIIVGDGEQARVIGKIQFTSINLLWFVLFNFVALLLIWTLASQAIAIGRFGFTVALLACDGLFLWPALQSKNAYFDEFVDILTNEKVKWRG